MFSKRSNLVALVAMLCVGGCASVTSQKVADSHAVAKHCEKLTRVQQSLPANSAHRPELAFHEAPHLTGASPQYVHGVSIYQLADGDIHDAYVDHTLACNTEARQAHPFHAGDVQSPPHHAGSHHHVTMP